MSDNSLRSHAPSSVPAPAREAYWRTAFAAPAPETPLPLDRNYPSRPDAPASIDRRTARLGTDAGENTLLAAFVALLHRYAAAPATEVTLVSTSGEVFFATTNKRGVFEFRGVTLGETYTVTPESDRFAFVPLAVSVVGDSTSVDMIANQ